MHITTDPPTTEAYRELQTAYDFFNRELFEGKLPPCLITMPRRRKSSMGYFSAKRFERRDGQTTDEIALNPYHFRRATDLEILSTLVHEMVHLWQEHFVISPANQCPRGIIPRPRLRSTHSVEGKRRGPTSGPQHRPSGFHGVSVAYCMERENLAGDAKGKGTSGSNREAESTDAPERGGLPRSSDEAV